MDGFWQNENNNDEVSPHRDKDGSFTAQIRPSNYYLKSK
jgi:hypothetical protein